MRRTKFFGILRNKHIRPSDSQRKKKKKRKKEKKKERELAK